MNLIELFDRKLLKFMLVGVVNTIVGSAIMFLLYNAAGLINLGEKGYWISSGANYFFTSILSFFLNKYFTFGARHWSVWMVASFVLTIVISYFIAYSLAKPLVYYLLGSYSEKIRGNISLFCGMCFFTALNYIGQRLVAFREKRETVIKEEGKK